MQTIITFVGIGLFIAAAYTDVKSFRISNMLVAAVGWLGVARLMAIGDPHVALYTAAAAFIVLIIGFLLFALHLCGGGDAKLVTAAALLVGHHGLLPFLLLMSISGAVISIAVLLAHRYLRFWLGPSLSPKARMAVPYGIAIATGAIATLFFQSPLLIG